MGGGSKRKGKEREGKKTRRAMKCVVCTHAFTLEKKGKGKERKGKERKGKERKGKEKTLWVKCMIRYKSVLGTIRTEAHRRYYRYRILRIVRYINTGTGHFGKFGTIWIPVLDTSVSSVQHAYRYWTLR